MRKPSRKTFVLLSLVAVLLISTIAMAIVLYTLTIPGTWRVNTSLGLELWKGDNSAKITSIDWTVDALGFETQSFILKNKSNKAVDVNNTIPSGSSLYGFTTTLANVTIPQGSQAAFTMTLTDLGMDSATTYTGSFAFLIVDHFEVDNDSHGVWFESTTIAYGDDTIPYLQFVQDAFDKANYSLGQQVTWNFTTKNPNESYILQSYSYELDLWNETAYQTTVFNGMSGSMLNLSKDQTNTITKAFAAPSANGTYRLKLTYTGHNSEALPPPTYAYSTSIYNGASSLYVVKNVVVEGFASPGQTSRVKFDVQSLIMNFVSGVSWKVEIFKNSVLIQTVQTGSFDLPGTSTEHVITGYFASPMEYGAYVVKISVYGGST